MTLKQLSDKVSIGVCLCGSFKVCIEYRGKRYYCTSNNTEAYDCISNWRRDNYFRKDHSLTPKQAYECIWSECLCRNNL